MSYRSPNLNWSHQVIGVSHEHHLDTRAFFGTQSDLAWPVANLCLYVPIYVPVPVVVHALLWVNGGTVSGNACMGLYDEGGNRIAQTGVVAQAGTSTSQEPSITAFALPPGRYFGGLALSNATGTMRCFNSSDIGSDANTWFPVGEESVTAAQVPTTMNPSASARSYLPVLGLRIVP